ncbi:winged helix-turn-helix transcriptional regulator|uniref:MarR family winged helix-turn-helix transcriptional regulator n=1 Tax=Stenotrophomonas sp. SbOxS2 TaxID=2723885 RepID=UPI0015D2D4F1|nr:MarR family winged helix-turn-helix transcriptional regulator [Stenotrophomonas sp. SbOxS2]NYT99453.1 winged helix-turn-helix transcriptional regulator [Stenotrophomonas sp. SbOxS2]
MIDKNYIPARCNCANIRKAARHITKFYDACLAPVGIRATQFTMLGHLKHGGPVTMLQLARLMVMDPATIGNNLRPLQRDGLVKISVSKADRRARIVEVTEAGLDKVAAGRKEWDRAQAEFEKKFGKTQAKALRQLMDSVVDCELIA